MSLCRVGLLVRVAFNTHPQRPGKRSIRVVSNPLELEVLPPGAVPRAAQPASEASLILAKAQLRMQEDRLNELKQLASGGRATPRELREQEVKVLEARARLAELAGPGTIPATQPVVSW